jgi:hypothetical protein
MADPVGFVAARRGLLIRQTPRPATLLAIFILPANISSFFF